ncbi:hypothetical protein ACY2HL_004406 [Enterobacter roggenkampii]
MKRITYAVAFFFFVAFSGFVLFKYLHDSLFACTADVEFIVNTNDSSFKLDGDYDFVINKENKASINVSGTFYVGNEKHEINRTYLIDYSKNKGDEYYTMRIAHKEIHSTDNTPTEIYEKLFIPYSLNFPFYLKVLHLKNNLYLIQGLKRSYFTCIRQ